MRKAIILSALCLIMFVPDTSYAKKVKGVDFPETASIGGKTCRLMGVGIRKKLIINVYLGALYLENPSKDARQVITSDQTKQVIMHFLYRKVDGGQLIEAWNEGFQKNSPGKIAALKSKIDRFNGFFGDPLKKGERIIITYIPGKGTEVVIRNITAGIIEGTDFMQALFSIWFGPYPPSKGLREGMLGE